MSRRRDLDASIAPVPVPDRPARAGALVPWDPQLGAELPDDEIDLRKLWETLLRSRWTILTVAAVVAFSTLGASLLMRPVYRAAALIEIRPEGFDSIRLDGPAPPLEAGRREFLETQFRIIESESVVDAVIARLDLAENRDFTRDSDQRGFLNGLRDLFASLSGTRTPAPEDLRATREREWKLRRSVRKRLSIGPVRNSNLVEVHFESTSPQLAAAATNAVIDEYIRLNDARRFRSSSTTSDFLEDQLALAEERLEHSERQLNEFARKNDIVDVDDRTDLAGGRVTGLSTELTATIQARIDAESLYRQAEEGRIAELPPVLESELIRDLKEDDARLSAEYQRLSRIYKRGYPKLRQLEAEIARVRASQALEVRRLASGIEAAYQKARRRETLLRQELEKEKTTLLDQKDRAVHYHILKREWKTNRELHAGLLEQMKRVGATAGMGANRVSIIDPARVPVKPQRPKPALYAGVALLVGLALGIGLALLLAHLDDVVRTAEDLESTTGLTSLGLLPRLEPSELEASESVEGLSYTQRRNPLAQALRSVRTNLLIGSPSVLQVTSASPGEGKTTTAASMAVVLAQSGARVLLVDADLRRPRVHAVFGTARGPGLAELLTGDPGVKLVDTFVPGLSLLPAGEGDGEPADLLGSMNMDVFLEQVSGSFDHVVLDTPPVLGLADATLVATKADAVILVVSAAGTRGEAAREAVRRLRLVGSPLVGAVLNHADDRSDRYGPYGYQEEAAEPIRKARAV